MVKRERFDDVLVVECQQTVVWEVLQTLQLKNCGDRPNKRQNYSAVCLTGATQWTEKRLSSFQIFSKKRGVNRDDCHFQLLAPAALDV
jgi:hypothetical protein